MRTSSLAVSGILLTGLAVSLGTASACGGSSVPSAFGDGGNGSGGSSGAGGSGSSGGIFGGGSSSGGSGSGSGGNPPPCPTGLNCSTSCQGTTTTLSGVVKDPAGRDGLYDVTVFVPEKAIQPLPKGVPMGADACNCGALFKSGAYVATTTGVDGSFKLQNVPVGTKVPLVVQVGKWRKYLEVNVKACADNPQGDIKLPASVAAGDTNDNMPDIAVSTGFADTLECLMTRIGLPKSEYVAGAGGTGHIHVFSGGQSDGSKGPSQGQPGAAENPGMAGAPSSSGKLWDSVGDLNPYDIVLLSCEGSETDAANPPALEQYLNGGGRVFASHYHYAWFSGPITTKQGYSAPSDWGNNLAKWSDNGTSGGIATNGKVVQTLNGSTQAFPKGQALYQWLGLNNALGVNGAPPQEVPILEPRYNALVGPSDKPSQPWINDANNGATMYFSFDAPVNAPRAADGGAPNYCGRAVFSDLHVGSASGDSPSPPNGCNAAAVLSPQEKVLEFMLFDLSACVISDSVPPPDGGGVPILQ